jgi:hypothetical protein
VTYGHRAAPDRNGEAVLAEIISQGAKSLEHYYGAGSINEFISACECFDL